MPNRCVVGGCNNNANKAKGILLHVFPPDKAIRANWVRFVRFKRKDWPEPDPKNRSAVVCSAHFLRDCYVSVSKNVLDCSIESGYRTLHTWTRKPDAVPSIFDSAQTDRASGPPIDVDLDERERARIPCSSSLIQGRKSLHLQKKERNQLVKDAFQVYGEHDDMDEGLPTPSTSHASDAGTSSTCEQGVQTETEPLSVGRMKKLAKSKVIIFSIPPSDASRKSVSSQFSPIVISSSFQTKTSTYIRSVYTQTPIDPMPCPQIDPMPCPPINPMPCPPIDPKTPIEPLSARKASTPQSKKRRIDVDFEDDANESSLTFEDSEKKDPTWDPTMSDDEGNKTVDDDDAGHEAAFAKLYVVSERKLLNLFRICQQCGSRAVEANIASMNGTLVTISQQCLSCDEVTKWSSQEMIGTYPSGNIRLSTALLCSGGIPSKAVRMLQFWGVQGYSLSTFFNHQRKFMYKAVHDVWEEENVQALINLGKGDVVQLSGDARCDSMGHCAKYASYTLHDTQNNAIVSTELVVSSEPKTKKSQAMEVLGLERCLAAVDDVLPDLKMVIITDGHPGVAKLLREKRSTTVTHYLDIWHVAKGVKKRIIKHLKKFPLVTSWKKSIINHIYWCAMTSNNDGAMMIAKWKSLANHLVNKHRHNSELYPRCMHGDLPPRRWFDPASKEYDDLCRLVILNKSVLKAISKLSSEGQTSGLEGFHSTLNHFAPKMYHFGFQGMKTRVELAALHFNENGNKGQKKDKTDGHLLYNIRFPKSRGGQYVVVPVMNVCTYGYSGRIGARVHQLVESGETYTFVGEDPQSLCAEYEWPVSKEQAVVEYHAHARFKPKP